VGDAAAYGLLFITALGAASVLPFGSEPLFVALVIAAEQPVWMLVLVASIGNVAGSVVNWALGRWIEHFRHRSWFPLGEGELERAQDWYRRYGRWSLLLSWAPLIGDSLTLVAGMLKEKFCTFLALVSFAKTGRYLALVVLAQEFTS
jgi:membrane protein YqaA with SNARE-associated domain